jgi:hypothetical protein
VLAAVAGLPLLYQSMSHALHLVESAFAPAGVRFSKFARLAMQAQRAGSGNACAQVDVEDKRHGAMSQAAAQRMRPCSLTIICVATKRVIKETLGSIAAEGLSAASRRQLHRSVVFDPRWH